MSMFRSVALGLAATVALGATACSGDADNAVSGRNTSQGSGSKDSKPAATGPCNITTPATVQKAFGGSVADGQAGNARNCTYTVTGGSAATVVVFYYGAATEFDGIKAGYAANRGPLTDVPGIGNEAFAPGDVGENEVVVRTGDVVFAVGINAVSASPAASEVRALADLIAADLS